MKKRVLPLFLAFVLAFGYMSYRPQKAYANAIALSSEGLEVLFGLLGSAGVVVGIDKTIESRFEEGQKLFDSLSSSQQQSYIDWLAAGKFVTSDTGHRVFQPDMELDTSWYRNLWNSVTDVCSASVSYAPPVAGLQSYELPASGAGDFYDNPVSLGSCSDSPFVVIYGTDGCHVLALLPSGMYLRYHVVYSTGVVDDIFYGFCPVDTELYFGLEYISYRQSGVLYEGFRSRAFFSPNSYGVSVNDFTMYIRVAYSYWGAIWGSGSDSFVVGKPYLGAMTYYDGAVVGVNELIPCDTWVSKWDDAKAEGRQVGIITGQDLSGYNTLDDIYNPDTGLVTGLDIPVSPEIPVTPDLTGIAGGLSSILNWLKALPATLSKTFLGTAELNFDALKNNGFTTKFPFSIPFDFYHCIIQLVASPAPPVFTLSFAGTIMSSAGDIVIDMSKFEALAKIVRFFVFFGFVLGLIKLTRHLIKG